MACTFQYNSVGEIISVRNEDGSPSKLFQDAMQRFGDRQQAIDIVAASLDENYIGDDSLNSVLNFIARENRNQNQLSPAQQTDLKNSLLSLNVDNIEEFQDKLRQAFYKGEIFNPTEQSLSNSGLYSPFEAETILNDISLQERIKNAVEALNNTEVEVPQYDNFDNVQKINEFNSFGKLIALNPFIVNDEIIQTLGGVETIGEFDDKLSEVQYPTEMTFEQAQQYTRVLQYPTTPTVDTYSALTLGVIAEVPSNVISAINTLINVPNAVAEQNQEQVQELVKVVEDGLISIGVDAVGLENDKPLLQTIQAFLISPTQENTNSLVSEYNRFFQIDDAPKEYVLKLPKDNNYVYSEINKPEDQLLVEDGLIKAGENLYVKVRRIPVEQLRQIVGGQDLSTSIENIDNPEYAEEIALLKTYFKVPLSITPQVEIVSDDLFEGDPEYLKNGFIADFQIAALKEKQKNSDKWKNFYSNFEINSRGLNLKSNDPITIDTVNTWLDTYPQIQQYSLISKQMPILGNIEQNEPLDERTIAVNNPMSVAKLNKDSYKIDNDNIIVKNADSQFTRVGNVAYEATETKNGLTLYTRLPIADSNYISYKNKTPKSSVDLQDFVHLQNTPDKFMQVKKGKENIIQENFNCL